MKYEFSLDKKQLILWIAGAAVIAALIFVSGLITGLRLWMPAGAVAQSAKKVAPAAAQASTQNAAPAPHGEGKTEPGKAESTKTEAAKTEAAKAEPAKTEPKTEATKETKPRPDAPYSIQLGSFVDEKVAKKMQVDLKERGYSTIIFKALDKDEKIWYAVRIGGFEDLDSAAQAAADFTNKEQIQALIRHTGAL